MTTFYRRFLTALMIVAAFTGRTLYAQSDSILIKVHFLHGSKPRYKFRHEENRWFGGVLGGHAGIECEPDKIVSFLPKASFHVFARPRLINSEFNIHDTLSFYEILGGNYDSVKKTIISIRISVRQKEKLDSVVAIYQARSPYDYAFFGMRCGAAAYDLLAQSGLQPAYSFGSTWARFFYPRKIRRRLERLADIKGYGVRKIAGSIRRIWEKD